MKKPDLFMSLDDYEKREEPMDKGLRKRETRGSVLPETLKFKMVFENDKKTANCVNEDTSNNLSQPLLS